MVDVLTIDDNLRMSTLHKLVLQLVDGTVVNVYGVDFRTRHHTVAHLRIGKVQRIMEYLDLLLYLVLILGIIDARLH